MLQVSDLFRGDVVLVSMGGIRPRVRGARWLIVLFQLPKQRKQATGTVSLFGCCKTQGLRTVTGILQASFTGWLLIFLLGSLICDTSSHPTDAARTEQSKSDNLVFSSHVSIITSTVFLCITLITALVALWGTEWRHQILPSGLVSLRVSPSELIHKNNVSNSGLSHIY